MSKRTYIHVPVFRSVMVFLLLQLPEYTTDSPDLTIRDAQIAKRKEQKLMKKSPWNRLTLCQLTIALLLCLFTGCAPAQVDEPTELPENQPAPALKELSVSIRNVATSNDAVTAEAKPGKTTGGAPIINLTVTNNTGDVLSYGTRFEVYQSGKQLSASGTLAFEDILYTLQPGKRAVLQAAVHFFPLSAGVEYVLICPTESDFSAEVTFVLE